MYLCGAAGGWWDEAAGYYQRGHVPEVGSILVFSRTGYTPSGHVAVVSRVISANEILVDHANWYRGRVSHDMPVIDTSPGNDWTTVAVMELGSGKYSRDNPTYGFVYPDTGPREIIATAAASGFDTDAVVGRASYDTSRRMDLVHFALSTEYPRTRYRVTKRQARGRYSLRLTTAACGRARANHHSAVAAPPRR